MIRYRLKCANDHTFDSWFKDSAAYDALAAARAVTCPDCGSTDTEKALMTPGLKSDRTDDAHSNRAAALKAFRTLVESKTEDVGERFPEEARRIHYGETDPKAIRGMASPEDAKALREEGVEIAPLPWTNRKPD